MVSASYSTVPVLSIIVLSIIPPAVPWPYLTVIVFKFTLFGVLSNVRTVIAVW